LLILQISKLKLRACDKVQGDIIDKRLESGFKLLAFDFIGIEKGGK
jgi:hypothetical protein